MKIYPDDIEGQVRYFVGDVVDGQCYESSEAYYHLMGGKEAGLTPIQGIWEGISHWAVRCKDGSIVDLTVEQFDIVPDYTLFRGRGFLTKTPSKFAQWLIDNVKSNSKSF